MGAQLAFKLVSEYPELFYSAIIVSPWLNKTESSLAEAMKMNEKQFASFKKKWLCNIIGMMNGLPREPRKKFVHQMQNVKIDTIRNSVNNGITFESEPDFAKVPIPIIALAGGKEPKEVMDSVKRMAEINPNCRCEIWDKAAHNIPPMFAKKIQPVDFRHGAINSSLSNDRFAFAFCKSTHFKPSALAGRFAFQGGVQHGNHAPDACTPA